MKGERRSAVAPTMHTTAREFNALDGRWSLLSGRRAQPVPDVPHLLVMGLWVVIRRIERQMGTIEPADGAQQRIGGHHAILLRRDQARARLHEILLGIEHL